MISDTPNSTGLSRRHATMAIPKTRAELTDLTRSTFDKLQAEFEAAGPWAGNTQPPGLLSGAH